MPKYALSIETGSGIPPDGTESQFDSVDEARDAFSAWVRAGPRQSRVEALAVLDCL